MPWSIAPALTFAIQIIKHRALIAGLRKRMYDWLQATDGMQIPLRREAGGRSDRRGPKNVKEYKFHGENK